MRNCWMIAVCAAALVGPGVARADKWAAPAPRVFAAATGEYGLKVIPSEGKAVGVLFTLDAKGMEKVTRRFDLVNIPAAVFVSPSGDVVTADTYGQMGYAHSLVVYSRQGKALADYRLEDLLSKEEIARNVKTTASSRWWREGARLSFTDAAPGAFLITLPWGREVRLALATGKLASPAAVAAEKPALPEDTKTTERLKGILSRVAAGTADPKVFAEQARAALFPDRIQQVATFLQTLGPLKSFQYRDQRGDAEKKAYLYRAVFGDTPVSCTFHVLADGRISGIGINPE